ncbi:hypothetical protein [Wenzhouxiangella sp. XN24]|uniref:hypothetical protein n=1 Tax=Wenzhouxiangella sp. XN24 TaxID=2713569 RepID=UPI0013EA1A83|nr:hypothetical protein [Wenzhouxiangella sp. XN24]NGX15641.1 hypothetical protein [Wenzhouxiangella sp. XN24]
MKLRGMVMTEVLVGLLVLGLAGTAVLALALDAFAAIAEARRTELAASLAADLAGRVRALSAVDWTTLPPALPCGAACAPEQLAALELAQWRTDVATTLPDGRAELVSGGPTQFVLTLAWTDTGAETRELSLGIAR